MTMFIDQSKGKVFPEYVNAAAFPAASSDLIGSIITNLFDNKNYQCDGSAWTEVGAGGGSSDYLEMQLGTYGASWGAVTIVDGFVTFYPFSTSSGSYFPLVSDTAYRFKGEVLVQGSLAGTPFLGVWELDFTITASSVGAVDSVGDLIITEISKTSNYPFTPNSTIGHYFNVDTSGVNRVIVNFAQDNNTGADIDIDRSSFKFLDSSIETS